MINITGQWSFFEQFEAGFDLGYALLKQEGNVVVGTLVYKEYINEENPFLMEVEVYGEIEEESLVLNGVSYVILDDQEDIEYCLDDRIAEINDPNRIEGHSVDDQNMEGRFILRRISDVEV